MSDALGVAGRRLRKVLGRLDLLGGQLVALIEARQRLSCGILLFLVVRAFLVDRSKTRERDRMTGCAEHLTLADDIGGNRIENGRLPSGRPQSATRSGGTA